MALDDQVMRDRINCLIESAGDQPYALEIRYHHKCWLKHVRTYQKMSDDDKLPYAMSFSFDSGCLAVSVLQHQTHFALSFITPRVDRRRLAAGGAVGEGTRDTDDD